MSDIVSKPNRGIPLAHIEEKEIPVSDDYQTFFDDIEEKLNTNLLGDQVQSPLYTVDDLPPVNVAGGVIFVTNDQGGPVMAFSDGENWRRCTDRAIVVEA